MSIARPLLRLFKRTLIAAVILLSPLAARAGAISNGCELVPPDPLGIQAGNNQIVMVAFQVTRTMANPDNPCNAQTGEVNLETANGTIVSVSSPGGEDTTEPFTFTADEGQTVTITYNTGPSAGGGVLYVACTTFECSESTNRAFQYAINVVDRQLQISGEDTIVTDPDRSIFLAVRATDDGLIPFTPITVNWTVIGAPATLDADSSTSDFYSDATNVVNVGTATPGNNIVTVVAARADDPTVTATFTITVNTYELSVSTPSLGTPVQAGTDIPLTVEFRANGSSAAGYNVSWAVDAGPPGTQLSTPGTQTDNAGQSTNTLRVGPAAGSPPTAITVRATIIDGGGAKGLKGLVPLAIAIFELQPFDLFVVAANGGNDQAVEVDQPFGDPLVVSVTRNGAPDVGGLVDWTVAPPEAATLSGAQSPVDGQGNASINVVQVNVAGPFTITAAPNDDPTSTVIFNGAGLDPMLGLDKPNDSGNGQFAAVNSPVANPLVVVATLNGLPQSNVGITWSVFSGSAALNPTSPTDIAGRSSVEVTMGATPGNVVVRAMRDDDNTVIEDYTLTAVSKMLIKPMDSGDNQSGGVGGKLSNPLVAVATLNGSPESGVAVDWSVVSGDALLSNIASPTDNAGRSSAIVTFGNTPGAVVVRAARNDLPGQFQDYTLSSTQVQTLDKPPSASGDDQIGQVDTELPQALVVFARNNGQPAVGVPVSWAASNGATVNSPVTITDSSGRAEVVVRLGPEPGAVTVTATRSDATTATASFVLTATPASTPTPELTLEKPADSGDGATLEPGDAATLTVVARSNGIEDANVPVFWQVLSGSAMVGAEQSISRGDGRASTTVVAGTAACPVTIRAVHGQSSATQLFTLTIAGSSGGTRLEILGGEGQLVAPGARGENLVVRLSQDGVPVANATVAWEIVQGDATLDTSSSSTGSGGTASNGITFGSGTGEVFVRASANGASTTFHLRAADSGANTLRLVSGNNQRGPVSTRADLPILVEVIDGSGQSVPGQDVDFVVQSGSATLDAISATSDGLGRASMGFRFGNSAGPVRIRASIGQASSQIVLVDATSFQPTLAIVSGNDQSGPVNTLLPQDLVVQIAAPPASKTLAGLSVRWEVVDGDGMLATRSSTTDANGRASNKYTLGPASGAQHIRASLDGGAAVTFTETATATAGPLTLVSGNNQTLPTRTSSAPLVVSLATTAGVPLQGATLLWAGDNVELANARTNTDTQGRSSNLAEVVLPGAARVTVSIEGVPNSSTVVFLLSGGVSNVPSLGQPEETVANAIDALCPALVALNNPTPAQADLRARCLELVDNAGDHPDQVDSALDEMRQDVALAQANAAFVAAQTQFDNLKTRIAALRSGSSGADFSGLALANSSGVMPLSFLPSSVVQSEDEAEGGSMEGKEIGSDFSRWGFFASGVIGRGSYDGSSVTPEYDYDTNGLTAGVDYRVNDQWVVGVSLGWHQQDTDLTADAGGVDTDGWSISGYTTWFNQANWYLDGVLTVGSSDYDLERRIRYGIVGANGTTTLIDQVAHASSGGDQSSLAFSFGRDFQRGSLSFGPYVRGLYTQVDFDAYQEQLAAGPGSGLGLAVESRELTSMAAVVGGKMTWALSRDWGILMPHAQLEWQHEFEDDPQQLVARFLHDPTGTAIRTEGDDIDTDFFNIGVGISALFANGRSAFLYYEHLAGSERLSQDNLSLGVRIEF